MGRWVSAACPFIFDIALVSFNLPGEVSPNMRFAHEPPVAPGTQGSEKDSAP